MSNIQPLPTAGQVRGSMPSEVRRRSLVLALAVLVPGVAVYLAAWFLTIVAPWWLWPVLSPLTGLAASVLFVIGHDAAHDALTPYRRLNSNLGRLLFIPSWHCYAGWVHAHNHIHHGWTNLQTHDYAWAPLSLAQYRSLSGWRRFFIRLYRWWPGFGLYYTVEILIKRTLYITPDVQRRKARLWWLFDNMFLLFGVLAQGAATISVARYFGITTSPVLLILAALIVPFIVVQWLIGFVTYLHHTHPSIPWFQDFDEWTFYTGQVLGTSQTDFAAGINHAIGNIMEHTAHHVDPRIPLYHLPRAQDRLAAEHSPVRHNFSWRSFAYLQRTCQLYDFDHHCWLDFSGRPTTSRTIDEVMLARARAGKRKPPAPCGDTAPSGDAGPALVARSGGGA